MELMTVVEQDALLITLKQRFEANEHRHPGIHWDDVALRLSANAQALMSLKAMEDTGGEPDVTEQDADTGAYIFCDCAKETPAGRRNLCYDQAALEARKANRPGGSAMETAADMGITLLDETQYRALQAIEPFDTKTSSWVITPDAVRALGGALFGDRRYDHVFIYHNGAESYYAARGFRGMLRV